MQTIKKYFVGLSSIVCLMISSFLPLITYAAEEEVKFEIMPQVDPARIQQINRDVRNTTGNIRDVYNDQAETLSTDEQVATGVMTRDTIINYGIKVLRFLSQVGLLIGALMIVYTGWKYIAAVITGDSAPSSELIKNAIYGILVIIFCYAILRILQRAFLG